MKIGDQVMSLRLEKQVTSLELLKELERLGVKQNSLFAWYQYCDTVYCEYRGHQASCDAQSTYQDGYAKLPVEICAAFTVAEHGNALPGEISVLEMKYYLEMGKIDSESTYYVRYTNHDLHDTINIEHSNTEADARTKMRIWLIKNKIVEVK